MLELKTPSRTKQGKDLSGKQQNFLAMPKSPPLLPPVCLVEFSCLVDVQDSLNTVLHQDSQMLKLMVKK